MPHIVIHLSGKPDTTLARQVADRDKAVDRARDSLISVLVEEIGNRTGIATVGVDLAFVVQSIERVGDHSKNIAEYVIHIVDGIDPRHSRRPVVSEPGSATA